MFWWTLWNRLTGRGSRRVRLHFAGDAPSIEGILVGFVAGHYRLQNPSVIVAAEHAVPEDGEAWVPRERVLHLQVLGQ
jgi:hypothetical protein